MRSKGAMQVPLPCDTQFSFLSQGIRRYFLYWSGHLASLFILISMLNNEIKIDFVICAVNQQGNITFCVMFIAQRGL